MHPNVKQLGIIAGFVIVGLLLLGNGLVTRHRIDVQTGSARSVLDTRQTLVELEEAESTLKDAEIGQRGYLLTGDPKYLTPYHRATTEIGPRIDSLARLTFENPIQQANVAELRTLALEEMDQLGKTVALYQAGTLEQAKAIVLSDKGLLLMDKLRLIVARMRQEETRLDGARDAEYQQRIRMTAVIIWLAMLIALLGLTGLAHHVFRVHALREKHAQELRAGEELYRTTLTSIGDAVIATDRLGKVTFMNPVAEKLTGIRFRTLEPRASRRFSPSSTS